MKQIAVLAGALCSATISIVVYFVFPPTSLADVRNKDQSGYWGEPTAEIDWYEKKWWNPFSLHKWLSTKIQLLWGGHLRACAECNDMNTVWNIVWFVSGMYTISLATSQQINLWHLLNSHSSDHAKHSLSQNYIFQVWVQLQCRIVHCRALECIHGIIVRRGGNRGTIILHST